MSTSTRPFWCREPVATRSPFNRVRCLWSWLNLCLNKTLMKCSLHSSPLIWSRHRWLTSGFCVMVLRFFWAVLGVVSVVPYFHDIPVRFSLLLQDCRIPRFQARGLKRIVLERSAADFISNSFNADWARLRTVKTRCYQLDQKLTTATVTRQPSFNGRVNEEHCTWRPLVGSSLSTHLLLLLERNTWPFQVI